MLASKSILVNNIKTNRSRKQYHGFISLKNHNTLEKIHVWVLIAKKTRKERQEELMDKKFNPEIYYYDGDTSSSIKKNIGLKKGEFGFQVDWFTDHPNITDDGIVSRLADLDSVGTMIAQVSKKLIETNIITNKKVIETNIVTNVVTKLISFTNLIVKGIESKGLTDIFNDIVALEGNVFYDPNKGVVINKAANLKKAKKGEIIEKIYLSEMEYEKIFPFSTLGEV